MACDALGLPVRMIVTSGNRNDITQVKELTKGMSASYLLADKGCDGKRALEAAEAIGAQPVIPQRKGAKTMRELDVDIYKARHLIENLFSTLKQFRRLATRYDKHLQNYLGFVHIAAIVHHLK